jgi:Protein of unknown function (DUF1153)
MLQPVENDDPDNRDSLPLQTTLPLQGDVRWTAWRKRDVVVALLSGGITENDAIERYRLSREELSDWIEGFERHGIAGLHLKRKRWAPAIAARATRPRAM